MRANKPSLILLSACSLVEVENLARQGIDVASSTNEFPAFLGKLRSGRLFGLIVKGLFAYLFHQEDEGDGVVTMEPCIFVASRGLGGLT